MATGPRSSRNVTRLGGLRAGTEIDGRVAWGETARGSVADGHWGRDGGKQGAGSSYQEGGATTLVPETWDGRGAVLALTRGRVEHPIRRWWPPKAVVPCCWSTTPSVPSK
jgi:hypothetical protein